MPLASRGRDDGMDLVERRDRPPGFVQLLLQGSAVSLISALPSDRRLSTDPSGCRHPPALIHGSSLIHENVLELLLGGHRLLRQLLTRHLVLPALGLQQDQECAEVRPRHGCEQRPGFCCRPTCKLVSASAASASTHDSSLNSCRICG
jgi:hypothetical protein